MYLYPAPGCTLSFRECTPPGTYTGKKVVEASAGTGQGDSTDVPKRTWVGGRTLKMLLVGFAKYKVVAAPSGQIPRPPVWGPKQGSGESAGGNNSYL